ncbi:hypothetical protein [Sphingorhabdus sp. Alg239-R122]|uniref:hypothetical protein n=1 Tax=Sphingorhabdus sp. Alg239-R122 TaxID=2305989 RepID=UPI0013DC2BF9|nr:hypothetical protein [Sphingorhabdus sp. Alg239-R122]
MNLPKIDIGTLPDMDNMVGAFGATVQNIPDLNITTDLWIVVVIYIYESLPEGVLF